MSRSGGKPATELVRLDVIGLDVDTYHNAGQGVAPSSQEAPMRKIKGLELLTSETFKTGALNLVYAPAK
jgi:hypothetical protein